MSRNTRNDQETTPRNYREEVKPPRVLYYPYSCPACGECLMYSSKQDPEKAMETKFAKCMISSNEKCVKATQHPSVAVLRLRLSSRS